MTPPPNEMALDALVVEIELSISAANLEDRDATSKSDPMCVVYLKVKSIQLNPAQTDFEG